MRFELRGHCINCDISRVLWGGEADPADPASLDALDDSAAEIVAACPRCESAMLVAFFEGERQQQEWMLPEEYERLMGEDAGPLSPKPWKAGEN